MISKSIQQITTVERNLKLGEAEVVDVESVFLGRNIRVEAFEEEEEERRNSKVFSEESITTSEAPK